MNREQLRFLASGILFGFLVGYVIAYAVHEPRVKQVAAPVPAAGNLGMSQVVASPPPGGAGAQAGLGAPGEELMERVFQEIAALKEAIAQDPANTDAVLRLANLFHDSGKWKEAIELYETVVEARPQDVNARTDMAICLREQGRIDEAIAQFHQSLAVDPHHWQTWLNLGIVSLFDKNDVATASEAFDQLEKFNPDFPDLPQLKEAVRKAAAASPAPPS